MQTSTTNQKPLQDNGKSSQLSVDKFLLQFPDLQKELKFLHSWDASFKPIIKSLRDLLADALNATMAGTCEDMDKEKNNLSLVIYFFESLHKSRVKNKFSFADAHPNFSEHAWALYWNEESFKPFFKSLLHLVLELSSSPVYDFKMTLEQNRTIRFFEKLSEIEDTPNANSLDHKVFIEELRSKILEANKIITEYKTKSIITN